MIETTNFGLKTYESDDVVNVMTVDKSNMEIIDSAMKVNQDSSIGTATELMSGTVHAITRINPDVPVFRFTATSNFTAGDTFVVDGIQVTALLPSGETLGSGAYIIGSEVLCALRDTLLTVYCPQGTVATASDSEKLGGQLPAYYATKEEVDVAQATATSAGVLAQGNTQLIQGLDNRVSALEAGESYNIGIEERIGVYNNKPLYRMILHGDNVNLGDKAVINATLTSAYIDELVENSACMLTTANSWGSVRIAGVDVAPTGLLTSYGSSATRVKRYNIVLKYTKASDSPIE